MVIVALVAMSVFFQTRMHVDVLHGNYYLGALFYGLIMLLVDGFPEVTMTIMRLPVFFKQRDLYLYPVWAYAIPATILKVPLSVLASLFWTSLTYYTIGYTPEVGRFFRQLLLLFCVHFTSISMFRFLAALFQTIVASTLAAVFLILFVFIFSGFIIPLPSMPGWLKWGFWVAPLTYGEIGLSMNFLLQDGRRFCPPTQQWVKKFFNPVDFNSMITFSGFQLVLYLGFPYFRTLDIL